MFLKVIACEIAFREICTCAARSPNLFDLEFLSQGYHDNPDIGVARIQERIDTMEPDRFDGVLVGYGLCNNMLSGLKAREAPLVVPRAHDCITFFLGSKERYKEYFLSHSGTYYYTAGWLEYRQRGGERVERKQGAGLGLHEIAAASTLVTESADPDANIIVGSVIDVSFNDEVKVTVIATGFEEPAQTGRSRNRSTRDSKASNLRRPTLSPLGASGSPGRPYPEDMGASSRSRGERRDSNRPRPLPPLPVLSGSTDRLVPGGGGARDPARAQRRGSSRPRPAPSDRPGAPGDEAAEDESDRTPQDMSEILGTLSD